MEKSMKPDLWYLYELMLKSRYFEEAVHQLWNEGKISGEMHLAIGEEAISAGIVPHLQKGDAMALDHRGTPQMIMLGIDPVSLLKEFCGHPDGLCNGMGGHMHLFSKNYLTLSSGIVGASGPAALGFAISAQYLRPSKIAVSFFGEGAINQGMLMESFNLAISWKLPILFICKDNNWAITTESKSVTGGILIDRAKSFGMPAFELDGSDISVVWNAATKAIDSIRKGEGPAFLHLHCVRPEGHFIGDPLIRISRKPIKEMKKIAGPLIKSVTKFKGSSLFERSSSLKSVSTTIGKTLKNQILKQNDPVKSLRDQLKIETDRLNKIENSVKDMINIAVSKAIL
jgi:pyruvate dehydrogenase E1 component alpha subunit